MLKRIFDQFADAFAKPDSGEVDAAERTEAIRRATAILMMDVALADRVFDDRELERVLKLTATHFGIDLEEAADLIEVAEQEAEELVSIYEFTRLLHKHLSSDEKASIVAMLWQIAYADGQLDKYEDALILKISDLLYVNRARVMRLKHDAGEAAG